MSHSLDIQTGSMITTLIISNSALSPQSSVLSPQSSVLSPQSSVLSPQSSALSTHYLGGLSTNDCEARVTLIVECYQVRPLSFFNRTTISIDTQKPRGIQRSHARDFDFGNSQRRHHTHSVQHSNH